MLTKVFAVFDTKSDSYGTPFFMPTRGMAIRAFADLVKDNSTTIARHPGDYKLCMIGEFDDAKGMLIPGEIESCGFASDYAGLGDGVIPLGVKAVS